MAGAQLRVCAGRALSSRDSRLPGEAGEDKNNSHNIAIKAGELKLYAEARLGELIKIEQEAGRLATSLRNPGQYGGCNDSTADIKTGITCLWLFLVLNDLPHIIGQPQLESYRYFQRIPWV